MTYSLRLLLLIGWLPLGLSAQTEAFNDYRATMILDSTGRVEVTERLSVTAAGRRIKRGIVRSLRNRPSGNETAGRGNTRIDVKSARRNGQPENIRREENDGYTDVYLGRESALLPAGRHDYELTYDLKNTVYFLEAAEDVRLPLFGSNNRLPLEAATVTLRFPPGAALLRSVCYTGGRNSQDQSNCSVTRTGNELTYRLTQPLPAGNGLTIGAVFAPGTFVRPRAEGAGGLNSTPAPSPPLTTLEKKGTLWAGLLGILGMFFYGYLNWQRYGVDPPTPRVANQYYPPAELTPAAINYTPGISIGYDGLTAALTSLVTKGYLDVREEESRVFLIKEAYFTISPTGKEISADLPSEEKYLVEAIGEMGPLELNGEYDKRIDRMTKGFYRVMEDTYKDLLHVPVDGWRVAGFFAIGLVACGLGLVFVRTAPPTALVVLGGCLLVTVLGGFLFWYLLQQPTPAQIELRARVKAFRNYLRLKEKDRRALPNAPEMSEEYFATVLPYAIGLGVRNDWADALSGDLAATARRPQTVSGGVYLVPLLLNGNFGRQLNTAYSATSNLTTSTDGGFSGGGGGVSSGGAGSGGW